MGCSFTLWPVSSPEEFENAFKEATKARSGALAVTRYRLSNVYQKRIIALAGKKPLAGDLLREDFAENGGLMSDGADEIAPHVHICAGRCVR